MSGDDTSGGLENCTPSTLLNFSGRTRDAESTGQLGTEWNDTLFSKPLREDWARRGRRCAVVSNLFTEQAGTNENTNHEIRARVPSCHLRGDPPGISTRIFDATSSIGIALSHLWLLHGDTSCRQRAPIGRIDVRDVDMQPGRKRRPGATAVGNHDDRVVDSYFRVHDGSVRIVVSSQLNSVERLF